MKGKIFMLTLVLGLWSCDNQSKEKAVDKDSIDTSQTITSDKHHQEIYIKDKSQYDQSFINGLADFNESIKLIDNYIITGTIKTYFPEDLELNKQTKFAAIKDNEKYSLTLTRTNLTNINYEFQLLKNDSIIHSKSGKAILVSGFFLGPEGEPDLETGESFMSNEYRKENKDSWLLILVGMDKNYEGKKRAKIYFRSKVESNKIDKLEEVESPILRLE
ncbi:MAG: hypothetical protein HYZ42_04765 [Bacteroidetes bacterium]|nr:hypothetical protein [Bacteroidota bacterium]